VASRTPWLRSRSLKWKAWPYSTLNLPPCRRCPWKRSPLRPRLLARLPQSLLGLWTVVLRLLRRTHSQLRPQRSSRSHFVSVCSSPCRAYKRQASSAVVFQGCTDPRDAPEGNTPAKSGPLNKRTGYQLFSAVLRLADPIIFRRITRTDATSYIGYSLLPPPSPNHFHNHIHLHHHHHHHHHHRHRHRHHHHHVCGLAEDDEAVYNIFCILIFMMCHWRLAVVQARR
jgi:hypothetical protein